MNQKVLLIMPKISAGTYDKGVPNEPPIGLAYLVANLKKNNIDCKPIDMRLGYSANDVMKAIKSYAPAMIGISLWSLDRNKTIELINFIKGQVRVPVVIGGPHVSAVKKAALAETVADFAIKGEGEFTIIELIEYLNGSRTPESIAGLIFRKNGEIIENTNRNFNYEIDDLPILDYEAFELHKYNNKTRLRIITSRGCPYKCNFCSVKLSMGRNFRPRNPEKVIQEIIHWHDLGYNDFAFSDDCFSLDLERAEQICDMIIEKKLNIAWHLDNGIRVDRVSEKLLLKMKQSGLKSVMFGVESADNQTLKRIGKNITIEQAKNAVELAKKVGVDSVGATFIIGHPGETFSIFKKNLDIIKEWPVDKIKFYNLVPYPGTDVHDWIKKNGRFVMSENQYLSSQSYYSTDPVFETDDFTADERRMAFLLGSKHEREVLANSVKRAYEKKYGRLIGYIARRLSYYDFVFTISSRLGLSKIFK